MARFITSSSSNPKVPKATGGKRKASNQKPQPAATQNAPTGTTWAYTVREPGIPTKAPRTKPFDRASSEESDQPADSSEDKRSTGLLRKAPVSISEQPIADPAATMETDTSSYEGYVPWKRTGYSRGGVPYIVSSGYPHPTKMSRRRPDGTVYPEGPRHEDGSSHSSTNTTTRASSSPSMSPAPTAASGSAHGSAPDTADSASTPAPASAASGVVPTSAPAPAVRQYDDTWQREALAEECRKLVIKGRSNMRTKQEMIKALNAFVPNQAAGNAGQTGYAHKEGAPFHENMDRPYLIKACKAHGIPTHDKRNRKEWSKALNEAIPVGSAAASKVAERVAAWEAAEAAGQNGRKRTHGATLGTDGADTSDGERHKKKKRDGDSDCSSSDSDSDGEPSSSSSSSGSSSTSSGSSSSSSDDEGSRRKKKKEKEEKEKKEEKVPPKSYHRRPDEPFVDHIVRLQHAIRDINRFLAHNQVSKLNEAGRKLRRQIFELKRRLHYLLNLSFNLQKDLLKHESEEAGRHFKEYPEPSDSDPIVSEEPCYQDDTDEIDLNIIPQKYRSRAPPPAFNCAEWVAMFETLWHTQFYRREVGQNLRRYSVYRLLHDVKQLFEPTGPYDIDEFPARLNPFLKTHRIDEMFTDMGINFNEDMKPKRVPSMIKWLILHLYVDKMRIARFRESGEDDPDDADSPPEKPPRRCRIDTVGGDVFEPRPKMAAHKLLCAKHRYAVRYWVLAELIKGTLKETGVDFVEERVEQWMEDRFPLVMAHDGDEGTRVPAVPNGWGKGMFKELEKISEVVSYLQHGENGQNDTRSIDEGHREETVGKDDGAQEGNMEEEDDATAEAVNEDGDAEMSDADGADEAQEIVETVEAERQVVEDAEDVEMIDEAEESEVSEAE